MVGAVLSGSPEFLVSYLMTIELISYLPMIDLDFTRHQVQLLVGSNQMKKVPDYIQGFECSEPAKARFLVTIACSNFLRTAQKELLLMFIVLGANLLVWLFARLKKIPVTRIGVHELIAKLSVKVMNVVLLGLLVKSCLFWATVHKVTSSSVVGWVISLLVSAMYISAAYVMLRRQLTSTEPLVKFKELKASRAAQVHYSFVILHRLLFALTLVFIEQPQTQITVQLSITSLVSPTQLAIYLVVIRPHVSVKDQLQQGVSMVVVACYCLLLVLKSFDLLESEELVAQGFMFALFAVIVSTILGLIITVGGQAAEIAKTVDDREGPESRLELQ
jgi:hypothetical protein